jgi:hypothetical protein
VCNQWINPRNCKQITLLCDRQETWPKRRALTSAAEGNKMQQLAEKGSKRQRKAAKGSKMQQQCCTKPEGTTAADSPVQK